MGRHCEEVWRTSGGGLEPLALQSHLDWSYGYAVLRLLCEEGALDSGKDDHDSHVSPKGRVDSCSPDDPRASREGLRHHLPRTRYLLECHVLPTGHVDEDSLSLCNVTDVEKLSIDG